MNIIDEATLAQNRLQWEEFLEGYWTKTPPRDSGWYPVCGLDGIRFSFKQWVYRNGELCEADCAPGSPPWVGWRWSEHTPAPPQGVPRRR